MQLQTIDKTIIIITLSIIAGMILGYTLHSGILNQELVTQCVTYIETYCGATPPEPYNLWNITI